MKITKYGHCCMRVEDGKATLLIDPGSFTAEKQSTLTGVSAVLYTHEHADHFHLQSLQSILRNNTKCRVICNPGVAALLDKEGVQHEVVGDGQSTEVNGATVIGHGTLHAEVHSSLPAVQNTGFVVAGRLWYPGDALSADPGIKPDIMALPLCGPWMKLSEALDYAIKLAPGSVFPVHDMILNDLGNGIHQRIASTVLESRGVRFFAMELDTEYEF
jgi:L-ascorbate metabolism protein UlaG (beta-lactamase superfamily)